MLFLRAKPEFYAKGEAYEAVKAGREVRCVIHVWRVSVKVLHSKYLRLPVWAIKLICRTVRVPRDA